MIWLILITVFIGSGLIALTLCKAASKADQELQTSFENDVFTFQSSQKD
jgi:hypothetical protein